MRRLMLLSVLAAGVLVVALAEPAWAGSPHFVADTVSASRSGNTLTVTGKEAGLGRSEHGWWGITVCVLASTIPDIRGT